MGSEMCIRDRCCRDVVDAGTGWIGVVGGVLDIVVCVHWYNGALISIVIFFVATWS